MSANNELFRALTIALTILIAVLSVIFFLYYVSTENMRNQVIDVAMNYFENEQRRLGLESEAALDAGYSTLKTINTILDATEQDILNRNEAMEAIIKRIDDWQATQ